MTLFTATPWGMSALQPLSDYTEVCAGYLAAAVELEAGVATIGPRISSSSTASSTAIAEVISDLRYSRNAFVLEIARVKSRCGKAFALKVEELDSNEAALVASGRLAASTDFSTPIELIELYFCLETALRQHVDAFLPRSVMVAAAAPSVFPAPLAIRSFSSINICGPARYWLQSSPAEWNEFAVQLCECDPAYPPCLTSGDVTVALSTSDGSSEALHIIQSPLVCEETADGWWVIRFRCTNTPPPLSTLTLTIHALPPQAFNVKVCVYVCVYMRGFIRL